jgi:hypothetical protein
MIILNEFNPSKILPNEIPKPPQHPDSPQKFAPESENAADNDNNDQT